jgi:hypothetical protein
VISGPYTKGSVKNDKRGFSSRSRSDEITMCGYRALTFVKCTTIMIAKLAVTNGLGPSLDYMVCVWNSFEYGLWCSLCGAVCNTPCYGSSNIS